MCSRRVTGCLLILSLVMLYRFGTSFLGKGRSSLVRPHKAFYLVERTFIKGRSTRHAIHSGNDINFAEKGWSVVDMASPQERRLINMKSRINSATPPKPDETIFKLDAADGETLDQMINGKQPRASQGSIFPIRRKKEDKQKPRSLVQHDLSRVLNTRDNSDQPSSAVRGFLELNPSICSGCGSSFQSKRVDAPGYLPPEKFHEHQEIAQVIRKQQDAVRILKMADIEYNSEAAEKMLKLSGYPEDIIAHVKTVDRESTDCDGEMTNQLMCICQRCFRLQQYGQVEHTLRPGWSSNQLLTPERFESLLSPIKDTKTVILCIVDVFDLQGSVVKNLKQIIGDNPLVIAVNKIDLLPKDISHIRVTNWVHSEIKRICGFTSPKFGHNVQFNEDDVAEAGVLRVSNVHLVSCQTNYGIRDVVKKVVSLASDFGNKVHVLGAANVGKSSFINRLLTPTPIPVMKTSGRKKVPLITVSNLPGTTLDFLRIKMPNGITVIDTPGLINKGHLTSKLTTDELKQVLPNKNITPVTLRLEAGKCVLMGGFAKIDVVEGRPFYFTFFASNDIKLHQTDSSRADSFLKAHVGKLIFPPTSYSRIEEVGPFEVTELQIKGEGWKKSTEDIVIPGMGWIAITGAGNAKVQITAPSGTEISTRPSLLPFEAQFSTAKFTGSKILKKSSK